MLTIEPHNEPDGEGNGWHPCEPGETGCRYHVYNNDDDVLIATFPTHGEAEAYVAAFNEVA